MTQLYRHYGADGELLYVGISLSAINRLIQHSDGAAWFPRITKVEVEKFEDREAAIEAEIRVIKEERPLFNRHHTLKATRKIAVMSPNQYREAIAALDLSQVAAGNLLTDNPRTSRRWASGESPVPKPVALLLRLMILYRDADDELVRLRAKLSAPSALP